MLKINEIIVVEGKDDTTAVKRAVIADTIETGGSAINDDILAQIKQAQLRRGVIILTDPDYPGQKIRQQISDAVPGCLHAFIQRQKAISKRGKCGVEHAAPEAIIEALKHFKQGQAEESAKPISLSISDLQARGLLGGPDARRMRQYIGESLHIGYANGKQFIKRILTFRISKEEFEAAYLEAKRRLKLDE
jgi:ribonuclease M5